MKILKIFTIFLALIQPIVVLAVYGFDVKSLSSLWGTPLQPLFIITNATTSFFMVQTDKWRIPSMFILLLTAFSMDLFPMVHNILAVCFFIACLLALSIKKRDWKFVVLYLFSPLIIWKFGLFWMEAWAIYVICGYHLKSLWILYKFENREHHD